MPESPIAIGDPQALQREPSEGRWIIGPAADVLFLMGGTWLGYTLLLSYGALRFDLAPVWFAWMLLFNGPHLFATYTRTYLAPSERRAHGTLLRWSLLLFLLGPALLLLCGTLSLAGVGAPRAPLLGFQVFVSLWAYWHVVRQHHGIVRLYQRRNGDEDRADRRIDFLLVHVGLLAPFALFLARHPEVRLVVGLPQLDPASPLQRGIEAACAVALFAVVALFAFRQGQRLLSGRRLNGPKLLFFATVVTFYACACTSEVVRSAPLFAISPLLVVPHDVQYHAMVRFYHRNRSRLAPPDLGARISASLPRYIGCALAMGALMALLSCATDLALGCALVPGGSTVARAGGITLRDAMMVTFQGFLIHHYFVDQFIWKPSRAPWVAAGLGLQAASA